VLDDLGEADDRDDVLVGDLAAVDLLEEVPHLLVAPELRVVVLDVPGRQLAEALDLDLVDDGLEDLLPRGVPVADRHQPRRVLAALVRLGAEPDGRGLAAGLELVGEDAGVEVEALHERRKATARPLIARSPSCVRARAASWGGIQRASSASSSWSAP